MMDSPEIRFGARKCIKSMIDCISGVVHERNIIHTQEVGTHFITTRFAKYMCDEAMYIKSGWEDEGWG